MCIEKKIKLIFIIYKQKLNFCRKFFWNLLTLVATPSAAWCDVIVWDLRFICDVIVRLLRLNLEAWFTEPVKVWQFFQKKLFGVLVQNCYICFYIFSKWCYKIDFVMNLKFLNKIRFVCISNFGKIFKKRILSKYNYSFVLRYS